MTKQQISADALQRAQSGQSFANYPAIFNGFLAKGIAETEIKPRENVLTFHAWKALGRSVKRGEHGVRVVTFIERTRERADGTAETWRQPWSSTVFHISQTEPTADRQDVDRINAGLRAERAGRDRRRARGAANWGPSWN